MRSLLVFILTICCLQCLGQDNYYQKLEQEALDAANRYEYQLSLTKAQELYASFPDNINAHLLVAFDLINLSRHKDAAGYISAALAIDPTNHAGYFMTAYYYVCEGDMAKAKAHLKESMKLTSSDFSTKEAVDEMIRVGTNTNRAAKFNELADWYQEQRPLMKERYPTLQGVIAEWAPDPSTIRNVTDKYVAEYTKLKWPEMALGVYGYACLWLRFNNRISESLEVAQEGYSYYRKNGYGNDPYQASFLMNEMLRTYTTLGNDERVVSYVGEILALSDKLPIHVQDVSALIQASQSYDRMSNNAESKKLAEMAYKIAENAGYRYGAVSAANALCAASNFTLQAEDINNVIYYGEMALQMGMKYKYEELLGPIMNNLALGYYKQGTRESQSKAIRTYGSLVQLYKDAKRYSDAALALNNVGAMMMNSGGYQYAAEYFEESIELEKNGMGELSADDKLAFYQATISAYEWLIACYAYLENPEKVYETIEASRSRVLTERLAKGKEIKPGTIADLQRMLLPDEAAVFYSLYTVDQVVILVVTKKYAKVLMHKDETFIAGIKEKYLDRINKEHGERVGVARAERAEMADFQKVTQLTRKFFEKPGLADNILKEYLQGYYRFLMLPILNRLGGIKSLLISPDDILNYIPFEALQTHNGKYLVETYNVRYLNSTGA